MLVVMEIMVVVIMVVVVLVVVIVVTVVVVVAMLMTVGVEWCGDCILLYKVVSQVYQPRPWVSY
jgi:hypothetical protein